jgi:4-hydroxy 2-oxovalerate aldolase
VDCTFQGMGRSSGNASTERLISLLSRMGQDDYDVIDVLKTGERDVRPRLPVAGYSGLDTFAGYQLFHTSYMPTLLETARKFRVDPYLLMQGHCSNDLVGGSADDMAAVARVIAEQADHSYGQLPPDRYFGNEQS